MGIVGRILNKFFVLEAVSVSPEWEFTLHELDIYEGKVRIKSTEKAPETETYLKGKSNSPFAIVIRGDGIISKNFERDNSFLTGIIDNRDEFIYYTEEANGNVRLTFMRRELYDGLVEKLAVFRLPVVSTRICADNDAAAEIIAAGREFYDQDIKWRSLLRGNASSGIINNLLFKRLSLPVLAAVLAILVANFYVSRSIRQRISEQSFIISSLNKGEENENKRQSEAQFIYDKYYYVPAHSPALIADRIASKVSAPVILSSITINPLVKKPASGTPPQVNKEIAVIKGESPSPSAVTSLAEGLREMAFVKGVQLSSFELNRDNVYVFEITMQL